MKQLGILVYPKCDQWRLDLISLCEYADLSKSLLGAYVFWRCGSQTSQHHVIFRIYPKYSDTSTPYHIYSNNWTSIIHYPMLCLKIAGWVANSVDLDETPRSAASHLGLNCLLRPVCPNTYGKYGYCTFVRSTFQSFIMIWWQNSLALFPMHQYFHPINWWKIKYFIVYFSVEKIDASYAKVDQIWIGRPLFYKFLWFKMSYIKFYNAAMKPFCADLTFCCFSGYNLVSI